MKKLLLILILILSVHISLATVRTAITNNGNWSNTSTWSAGVVPTYGDSVVIPANITINFNLSLNQSYSSNFSSPIKILVMGTLYFPSGKKLSLPCGSMIYVTGWITAENQTGGLANQSNIINICSNEIWYSGMGSITDTIYKWDPPLPVSLISFDVKCSKKTTLTWSTATETNNDHFTLERSTDAEKWEFVTNIPGAGNSNEILNYQFTDENSIDGLSYYRLKQTDFDGKNETFSPVSVICSSAKTNDISMFPNPFKSELIIQYSDLNQGKAQVKVYDMMGKIIADRNVEVSQGNDNYILDLHNMADGLYNVEFTSGDTHYHQKVFKD
jgi:hypothetical protein